jgi:hypothetical protein
MPFTPGSTAFGVYDNDAMFASDADHIVKYVSVKLGGGLPPIVGPDGTHVQVELSSSDIYTCFEEATVEYSAIVNAYQAKSAMASYLGSNTGSLTGGQNRYPANSLEWARRQAQPFGEEAYVGGNRTLYSASIQLQPGVQDYDLQELLNPTGSDGSPCRIIVRKIFHFSPFATARFFGTTAAINYLNGQFNFQSFTPESVFYMLPVWEDVLRGAQFELSNKVRRSNYSFEMHGPDNVLKVLPCPNCDNTMFLTYNLMDMSIEPVDPNDPMTYGVSNLSDIPFGNISYSSINSIGRQWIWKMSLSYAKEVLGLIRRKMLTVPIPGGDLQLDGSDLVNDSRQEMDALRGELRDLLDSMTYDKLAAKEAEQAANLTRLLSGVPMRIYTG